MKIKLGLKCGFLVVYLLMLAGANASRAGTRIVTSLADDGMAGTLRAEIALATAGDTITFQNGLSGTITLNGTELLVQKNLTIEGPGAGVITVSGNNVSRVFHFLRQSSTPTIAVSVSGLTITGGKVTDTSTGGGGIYNESGSTLTLDNSTVSGNRTNGIAGGINNTGRLTLSNSTISGNTASSGSGGGINNYGTLTIRSSTISGNTASSGFGGGIYNYGTLTISSSTVSGNTATATSNYGIVSGGGIYTESALTVTNSTIFGNTISNSSSNGSSRGGGIYSSNALTVTNSTIFGNTASGSNGSGGGISNSYGAMLSNSIVAGNTAPNSSDIQGSFSAADYNLVQNLSGASLPGTHNITGLSPSLGALTDNGGPTKTMMPQSGSLAINTGDPGFNATNTPNDQRGYGRVRNGRVDIGAVEFGPPPPTISISDVVADERDNSTNRAFTITLGKSSDQTVSVDYTTADGTAAAPQDYTATSGTVTFLPGESLTQTVVVPVVADADAEGTETFTLNLSNAINALIADSEGLYTIKDTIPDLLIKPLYSAKPFALNDVYQSTPSGAQVESLFIPGSGGAYKVPFEVKIQNDSTAPRTFVLKATESEEANWTLSYRIGKVDITAAVRSTSGYTTTLIAPGAGQIVSLLMIREANIVGSKSATVNAFLSSSDTAIHDSVRAVATVDATAPTTSFTNATTTPTGTAPVYNATVWGKLPVITGVASDAHSGVAKVEVQLYRATATAGVNEYWNGREWVIPSTSVPVAQLQTSLSPTGGGTNVSWSINAGPPAGSFADGVYYLRAVVTDNVTRRFTTAPLRFSKTTDATSPTVSFTTAGTTPVGTTPANNSTITGAIPTITGIAGDVGSGVAKVELQLYRATATAGVNEYWNGTDWIVPGGSIASPYLITTLNPAMGGVNVTWSKSSDWPVGGNFGNGIYYLRAYATDRVDRRTASVVSRFTKATATSSMPQQSTPSIDMRVPQSSSVRLSSMTADSSEPSITLVFSGALDGEVAQGTSHYSVKANGNVVVVESAIYNAATKTVTLKLPSTGLEAGDDVSVAVRGLTDGKGLNMADQSATVNAF